MEKNEVSEDLRQYAAALYDFGGDALIVSAILDILAKKTSSELQTILADLLATAG
ncbi:MAG: hypothetical protein ACREPR_18040 [Brasilonema sp.]